LFNIAIHIIAKTLIMAINTFFKMFLPKDRVFFTLFENMTEVVGKMATQLQLMVNESDEDKRAEISAIIENLEHKNDDFTHSVFTELGRNFITPLDREDIHALATALDDIADYIYASAKKISFYKINPNDIGIHKLADLVLQGSVEIKRAVHGLRDMKNLREMTEAIVRINSIENQADDVFDMSIDSLFNNENDFKEVIKKREIYQVLEIATDKCEDAANVIESIIIKYA
jgi:predicted phosphate transport protein (TIGR00153 family)